MSIGLDLGSRGVKIAYRNGDELVLRTYDTFKFYQEYASLGKDGLLINYEKLGLPDQTIVSTGYGHLTIKTEGGYEISEIKAHVEGAKYQSGLDTFTLLDLGGQDSKAVAVRYDNIVDFNLNNKCGAGSGRYLENMANILEMSLEEAGLCYDDPANINSTCAVFGESELISLIIEGHSKNSLMAGVNLSIVKRAVAILPALKSDKLVFTGGMAQSEAICKFLEEITGMDVIVPQHYRHNGAIGCLVYGEEKCK